MKNNSISSKLFLTLFLAGLANIFLAYWFFYSSSVSLLKERSAEQMVSVRTIAAHKISLYLDRLKTQNSDRHFIASFEKRGSRKIVTVKGDSKYLQPQVFQKMEDFSFYPAGTDELMIRIPGENGYVVRVYSGVEMSGILEHRDGLGQSGEIYIVDERKHIRSASRHIRDQKSIIVDNDSVKMGLQGKSGVHEVLDYRGVEVLSAYSPFKYDKLKFVLLSEIDKDEVLSPLNKLFPRILMICGILCCVMIGFAYFSTRKILNLMESMKEQINNFHIRLINTMEEEKKRMSYNLHDGVGQILTALKWGVSRNENPGMLKELCDDAFREIRSISDNLMPAVLTEFGFFSAIREYLLKQERVFGIKSTYRYSDLLENASFREGMDVNLYRMIQELIHNTIKHSGARSISLVLLKENDSLLMRYEDDGIGMTDTDSMPRVLLYRSELMGASIRRSRATPGLVYEISIPLKRLFHDL